MILNVNLSNKSYQELLVYLGKAFFMPSHDFWTSHKRLTIVTKHMARMLNYLNKIFYNMNNK